MNTINNSSATEAFNAEVKAAYFSILKATKTMLATIEQVELRFIYERNEASVFKTSIIHELISPLLYLRLEHYDDGSYAIHFGFEQTQRKELSLITAAFMRSLYKATSSTNTPVNIECCIKTDWMQTSCSDLFEYISDNNRYYHFKRLRYRSAMNRKQLKVVA
ncbi:MAG: hypothetical protein ACTHNW_01565 [Mucilaginibacter sp.]